ncbi:MAG: glycosyltransferase family 39 protein [Acidobacteriota bacterium]
MAIPQGGFAAQGATGRRRGEPLLAAALLALLFAVWLEPPGSFLAEPDEARYAEIPREMLAAGDFVTPRLNGVPYFEKPPLLYWANAASLALFGQTPWSARLPTRLAGTATALLLAWAVARLSGRDQGLSAGIFFLAAPFGFACARTNLTDGVLTFFFTATLLCAFAVLRRAAAGRPAAGLAAAAGALAGAGFLSKGLIAIVLPGGVLLFWALATKNLRSLRALLLSPGPIAFAAVAAPWPLLAERANPGFLQFFFVREHFQRFSTPAASRPGPIYYFAALFLAGFLPGLPFFFRGAREGLRRDPVSLFFLIWFSVVLVFFSISQSKLPPYIFPAFPAAAALAARGLGFSGGSAVPWRWHAALVALFLAALAFAPDVRGAIAESGLLALCLAGSAALLAGAAWSLRARGPDRALVGMGLGWAGLFVVLGLAWPRLAMTTDLPALADAAQRSASSMPGARIVSYRCYVQTFPWRLRRLVPLADYRGELEDQWLSRERREEIFWTRSRFWARWGSGDRLVVLLRARERADFEKAQPAARFLECRGKYCVAANW